MPVVPMVIVSALLMIVVSMMTKKPADSTLAKIFWRSKTMKKLVLALVAIALVSMSAGAQTGKRRAQTGPPNGLFSPAIVTGDLVFTSGQIGLDPKTGNFRRAVSKRSSSRCSRI